MIHFGSEPARSHRFVAEVSQASFEGFIAGNQGIAGQILAGVSGMAFSHHELSVKIAVIPFSLSRPTRTKQACPVTFEMEHSYR